MNTLKKLTIGVVALASVITAPAVTWKYDSLLNGYNLNVSTNAVATPGYTNNLYTAPSGQVLYSLTNNIINGTWNTSSIAGDAFSVAVLSPDANGDINGNASVWIQVGNTNLIPMVTTNAYGQWFIPPAGFTNAYFTTAYGGWPFASAQYPVYMYPATTNYYPAYSASMTNPITITLYKAPYAPGLNGANPGFTDPRVMWDTTSSFSFSVTATGLTPLTVNTNLPTGWLQGAAYVKATLTCGTNLNANCGNELVNQLGILQPQP